MVASPNWPPGPELITDHQPEREGVPPGAPHTAGIKGSAWGATQTREGQKDVAPPWDGEHPQQQCVAVFMKGASALPFSGHQ